MEWLFRIMIGFGGALLAVSPGVSDILFYRRLDPRQRLTIDELMAQARKARRWWYFTAVAVIMLPVLVAVILENYQFLLFAFVIGSGLGVLLYRRVLQPYVRRQERRVVVHQRRV